MSAEEILKAVAGVGFPAAVAVYLLIVFGNKLDKLTEAVNSLTHFIEGLERRERG